MRWTLLALAIAGLSVAAYASAPPGGGPPGPIDVNVTNPVLPVEVSNADPIPVVTPPNPPVFVQGMRPVFISWYSSPQNSTTLVPFSVRTLVTDLTIFVNGINDVAGCHLDIGRIAGGGDGPSQLIFNLSTPELNTASFRDGRIVQQSLGRGVVFEPADEMKLNILYSTDPETPNAGENYFCSIVVQWFGEEIE